MKRQLFYGTANLIGLAWRRDRIRLASWILGIGALTFLIALAYAEFSTQEMTEMITMASISQGLRLLVSPIRSGQVGQLGSFFMFRTSFLISLLIAMMNTQIVVRHTRHNEETGCAEMIGSTVIGRHASLAAALIIAGMANAFLGIILSLSFIASGMPLAGSLIAAAGFASLGLVFAGFAAVAAQISESSRGASGIASIFLAITFLLNGIGNVMGTVHEQAMGFSSHSLVWLSPIGWLQQMHVFGEGNVALLSLFAVLTIVFILASVFLSQRRDIGRGIIPAAKGPAKASRWLLSPLGLAWRLQRKALLGWTIGMVCIGLIFGTVSQEYGAVIDDIEVFNQFLLSAEFFIFSMIAIVSAILAIYPLQSLMRLRSEEQDGPLETVLSTPTRRLTWLASFIFISLIGTGMLLVFFTMSTALAAQSSAADLMEFIKAAVQQGSAIFAIAGTMVFLYGALPRLARGLSWLIVLLAIMIGPLLGPMLNLPGRLMNVSPFTHIAVLPQQTNLTAVLTLLVFGSVLSVCGAIAFQRRNLKL